MQNLGIIASLGGIAFLSGAAHAQEFVVQDWNDIAVDVGRRQALGPNAASRLVAITQIAVFEAVNSVEREREPYRAYLTPSGPASLDAAVAQAAHDVLITLQPAQASNLDFELGLSLSEVPDGPEKDNGIELGWLAASGIVTRRLNDGSTVSVTDAGSTDVGKWRPTPRNPEFLDSPTNLNPSPPLAASDPQWGGVTPFALLSRDQFRAPALPDLTGQAYADAVNEVKALGAATGSTRTTEQTSVARFWAQQSHIPFNAIARTLSRRLAFTIEESAHLFAVLNIALADSRIATWDTKYHYDFWRPITAIRSADLDGNDLTDIDAAWNSFLDTPNHPEYVSGHSATGAAGAAVLATIFGNDISFAVGSDTLTGVTRAFTRLQSDDNSTDDPASNSAARENAFSRLYGGIHFKFSNEAGLTLGRALGEYEVANVLRAVPGSAGTGGTGGTGQGGEGGSEEEGGNGGAAEGGDAGTGGGLAGTGGSTSGSGGASSGAGGKGGAGGSSGGSGGKGGSSSGSGGKGGSGATGGSSGGSAGKGGTGGVAAPAPDDSGCSCSVPGTEARSNFGWLATAALAAAGLRRRRRPASS